MTWPGWGEVFPSVVGAVTLFAVLVGGMRALTHTVAEQASAAAKEATDALYERLKNNDFRHVEERIDRGLAEAHADREAMETRIRERFDRMGERFDRMGARMEARILAAVRRPSDADVAEAPSEAERAEKRSSPGP